MPEGKQWGLPLQALLETAETLNTASARLNTILHDMEQKLVAAHIGLEVWLTDARQALERSPGARLSSDGVTSYTWVELGFTSLPDGWHLAARHIGVEEGPPDDDGDPRWTHRACVREPYPIAQASRRARIAALRLLPALIKTLRQEAHKAIKTIEKATHLNPGESAKVGLDTIGTSTTLESNKSLTINKVSISPLTPQRSRTCT